MKKRLSCFIEQLRRFWAVLFSLVIFPLSANINTFALRNCIGHELILNHFRENIVHKALTAVASQKMPLLLAYKPDTAYFLDDNEKVYVHADKMPYFPGGSNGLYKFCSQNMHYPEQALKDNKSGTVRVGFIIGKDGAIRKAKVVKSAGNDLNEEALRVVQNMPKWKPGKLQGKKVPVYFVMPLSFEIPEADSLRPFTYVDHMPEFPGGSDSLLNFLGENIRYPLPALENDIQGMVVLRFIVENNGKISNIQVVRPVEGGCSEEAVRVVKKMPAWIPGSQNGKNVRVYFVLPVRFVLKPSTKGGK